MGPDATVGKKHSQVAVSSSVAGPVTSRWTSTRWLMAWNVTNEIPSGSTTWTTGGCTSTPTRSTAVVRLGAKKP